MKKFVIITFVPIVYKNNERLAYGPYVKEMDLWLKHVDEIMFVCPKSTNDQGQLLKNFETNKPFKHLHIPEFAATNFISILKAIPQVFFIAFQIFRGMIWANHIHLRCPGNTGLIACFIQILFPWKKKTAKYAGNWDWASNQPFTYRLQQKLLRNTILTHNMKVMVYGNWPDKTKNIEPFFTATYRENEVIETPEKNFNEKINLIYVGYLSKGKQPLLTVKVAEDLSKKGFNIQLNMFGNGEEKENIEAYINQQNLQNIVTIHGNKPSDIVKQYFQASHFLVFISKSEGWPKVVAESMFWGCLPITTKVSCVPEMVANGLRGSLVSDNQEVISKTIESWIKNEDAYKKAITEAKNWSRQFTLEAFEEKIKELID